MLCDLNGKILRKNLNNLYAYDNHLKVCNDGKNGKNDDLAKNHNNHDDGVKNCESGDERTYQNLYENHVVIYHVCASVNSDDHRRSSVSSLNLEHPG